MAEHQVVSTAWIKEHYAGSIRRISDMVDDLIDDELTDLGQELTHTCKDFNEGADCDHCLRTLDQIKDNALKAVFEVLTGSAS